MRKLTYFVACSLDGFIAREEGSIGDFTFDGPHVADILDEFPETIPTHLRQYYDVEYSNKRFDIVLMGRGTYQTGLDAGFTSPYSHLDQYVFSTTLSESPDKNVTLVSDDAVDHVRSLKQQSGLDIWLCGGGQLASTLFDEIDNLVIKSNPMLLGSGKSLFAHRLERRAALLPVRHKQYPNGFTLSEFTIDHAARST